MTKREKRAKQQDAHHLAKPVLYQSAMREVVNEPHLGRDEQLRARFGLLPERWAYPAEVRMVDLLGGWWIAWGQFA